MLKKNIVLNEATGLEHFSRGPSVLETLLESVSQRLCILNLQEPVQEWGEEEEDGAVFGITLRREPVLPASDTAELSTAFIQYHTVKVRRLKAATLERLVTHLLDPEHQEPDFAHVFLATYRAFTTTSTLIELLFQR